MSDHELKKTLSQQIYDILVTDILKGRIVPGDKLTNRELQQRFGISSTPIRDAIRMLAADGLLENVTNAGAYVIRLDPVFTNEINTFISVISCDALRLSAKTGRQEEIVTLLKMYQKLMAESKDDEYFEHDFHYHKTFFDYCENRLFKDVFKQTHLIHRMLFRHAIRTAKDRRITIAQHRQITQAFADGDYELACRYMEEHFQTGISMFKEVHAK